MAKSKTTLAMLVLLTACTPVEEPLGGVATGMLQTRDYIITMFAGSQGSLYSVHTLDGTLLEQDIDLETMVARFPELSHLRDNRDIEWADVDRELLIRERR